MLLFLEFSYNLICAISLPVARLEYEQKRDVDIRSRIAKLESTLGNLRRALRSDVLTSEHKSLA